MSRRTKDAHKAILDAWKLEADFIQDGKGTRDWTAQQQKDILERGKAYDDGGLAFQDIICAAQKSTRNVRATRRISSS